jgi:hypothetical protein
VGQLSFFTRVELAAMRDRTRSRRYSPQKEAFRREHERRRAFGLAQRHSRKLRELHGGDGIVALTAAMLGRASQACDPPLVEQPEPPLVEQPEPPSAAQAESPMGSAQPDPPVVAQVKSPAVAQPDPPTEPPVTEQAEPPAMRPPLVHHPVMEHNPEAPRPELTHLIAAGASIRRRMRHLDRGVSRCDSESHTIPMSRSRKPILSALGAVRGERHPP